MLLIRGKIIKIMTEKEFLYVGKYTDLNGNTVLKIGTTNDLERRRAEHNKNYSRAKTHTMQPQTEFNYIWHLPLSKYNTLRYEDSNRKKWQEMGIGKFIRNDRFVCDEPPSEVVVKIRKEYVINISQVK